MPRIDNLPPNTEGLAADDVLPIHNDSNGDTEKTTLTQVKEWLQSLVGWISTTMLSDSSVTPAKISLDDVAKEALNGSDVTITSTTPVSVASVSITVTKITKVVASCNFAYNATAASECTPRIYLNGSLIKVGPQGATIATGGGRYDVRSMSAIVTLPVGANTVEFRVSGSAGTITIAANTGQLTTAFAGF